MLLAAGCAPPQHRDPVPHLTTPDTEPLAAHVPETPPSIRVGIFDPSGSGNWAATLNLAPAPAALVAPCLARDSAGWLWVRLDTHDNEASTTSIVEASPSVSDSAQRCIATALAGAHLPPEQSAMQLLVYVTFSPAPK